MKQLFRKYTFFNLCWLCIAFVSASAAAQEPKSMKFKILDGTSGKDVQYDQEYDGYYQGKILAPGMTVPQQGLSALNDVDVYVVAKQFADTVIAWQIGNRRGNDGEMMVEKFYRYYRSRYRLNPAPDGTYDLRDALECGKYLQKDFQDFFDYWNIGAEDIDLIIVNNSKPAGSTVGTGIAEKHQVRHIQEYYESSNDGALMCYLYYQGAAVARNVDKVITERMVFNESSIQVGNQLRFTENFEIAGRSSERLIIDRYIETCRFEEDYEKIKAAYETKISGNALERAKAQIAAILLAEDTTTLGIDRRNPYVFSGIKFNKAMHRRTGGDLSRDTMDYFRKITEQEFALAAHHNDIREVAGDSTTIELDYNLFNHYLYKYNSFWNTGYNFLDKLPRDGGRDYDNEGEPMFYTLRTDKATTQSFKEYINKGKKLSRNDEGYVPPRFYVREIKDKSIEYLVAPFFADVLASDEFHKMVRNGTAQIINRNEEGNQRIRIKNKDFQENFLKLFEKKSLQGEPLYLTQDTIRKTQYFWWTMPDPNKYYHMRHVNYLHDFIHADTSSTDCDCTRTNDLRFITLSSEPAQPDCPPVGGNGLTEDYKPRSKKGEESSVARQAYLEFAQGQSNVNPTLRNNRSQLDTLRQAAYDIIHEEGTGNRIDSIIVIGISSPEGSSYEMNKNLAKNRAGNVANWVGNNCEGTQYAAKRSMDSVATWLDVANMIDYLTDQHVVNMSQRRDEATEEFSAFSDTATARALANKIRREIAGDNLHNTFAQQKRIGYAKGNPIMDAALERLRKVDVRYVYKATMDPSEDLIIDIYQKGGNRELYGAYYYYILLKSNKITHEEKLQLATEVINRPRKNDRFLTINHVESASPEQWFDLIRPLAANIIATDSIRTKKWNTDILAPYITMDQNIQTINAVSQSFDNNKYYKYVNADFIVYNQIQMLLGIGNEKALQRADSLIQMFAKANVSNKFRDKYHPEYLADVIQCYYNKAFISDTALANRIKSTNLINYFVINMSIAHEHYYSNGSYTPSVRNYIKECHDSIPSLQKQTGNEIERLYFTAVTEGRYGDFIGYEISTDPAVSAKHREMYIETAKQALVELFKKNPSFIGICQGDRYIRGIYRNNRREKEKYDYYLEAVETYIDDWMKENSNVNE